MNNTNSPFIQLFIFGTILPPQVKNAVAYGLIHFNFQYKYNTILASKLQRFVNEHLFIAIL